MDTLRIGGKEQFSIVRQALLQADFTESAVCARIGCSFISDARSRVRQMSEVMIENALDVYIRLFLDGTYLPVATVAGFLTQEVLEAFLTIDLLRTDPTAPRQCAATVMLYPTKGVYIASDRDSNPDSSPFELPSDTVYPALIKNTQRFLSQLPDVPCERYLEMCGGAGAAAIIAASRKASVSISCDITPRSTHFARFNGLLNGLENFTALCGDLYAPIGDETFDIIVAHPPYVPATGEGMIYKEGGDDGESITRAIIAGLPKYLRPGGQFQCTCGGSDRETGTFEERAREWLGPAADEFDILFVTEGLVRGSQMKRWEELRDRYKIIEFVLGSFLIQRKATGRRPITLRRVSNETVTRESSESLLATAAVLHAFDAQEILALKPRIAEDLVFNVQHKWADGAFTAIALHLTVRRPFPKEMTAEPWVIRFLEACDGTLTCAQVAEKLRKAEIMGDATPEALADTISTMILNGLLTI